MAKIGNLEKANPGAFAINIDFKSIDLEWSFARHHLIYAASGMVCIETAAAIWRLPPSRAVWLHAGAVGQAYSATPVQGVSIFFGPDFDVPEPFHCRVFNVSPLAREMILHSLRWGPDRALANRAADRFFMTLADVCQELADQPDILYLPKARTPELQQILDHTVRHLDAALQFTELARLANVSERTLSRWFAQELHMTWRQYLQRARMIRAMDLLVTGHNVTTTAFEVGFQNPGAFSTAFQGFTSLTPSQYQKQFRSPVPAGVSV